MKNLDKVLEKTYNILGNDYLTKYFDTGPFEFKVNISKDYNADYLPDYIVEIYSVPNMPKTFKYKGDDMHGVHLSVIGEKFKEYIKYVDSTFGGFGKTIGVKFMNVK